MLNSFIDLLKTPKTQLGILLTLIFITAFLNNPSLKVLVFFLLALLSTVFSDLLFLRLRNVRWFFPSSSLVTGSIIGLLVSSNLSWYVPVVVGVIAMFSKNFIRFSNRRIFNPAGFGLLFGAIIFGNAISWWAVSFQQFSILPLRSEASNLQFLIPFLILLSPALVSMFRMKRYRITLSFFVFYILVNKIFNSQFSTFNLAFDPTTLFFATVMLPEPMTSPHNHKRQILFGSLIGLLSLLVSSLIFNFPASQRGEQFSIFNSIDPFIFALLIGNLLFFKLR